MNRIAVATTALLLSLSLSTHAQTESSMRPGSATDLSDVIEYATPPELIADSVVVLVPDTHMSLDKPVAVERAIPGRINKVEKGLSPNVIVYTAHTMIHPLKAGVPMKLYLKRFPDRDAYYPIAIFPVSAK